MKNKGVNKVDEQEIIYYNANIIANVAPGTNIFTYNPNQRTLAYYKDSLSAPLLKKCSDYRLTIAAMEIPLDNVPITLITPNITLFPSNPLATYYQISMSYNGFTFTQVVLWQQEDFVTPGYMYALMTYQNYINCLNKAFLDCYTGLNLLVPLPSAYAPYYIYNSLNFTLTLITDFINYNSNGVNPIKIYYNVYLYGILFNTVSNYINGDNNSQLNYQILVENTGSNLYDQTGANQTLYYDINALVPIKLNAIINLMSQEYSTLWRLCDILNIVVVSKTIPVSYESTSPQTVFVGPNEVVLANTLQGSGNKSVILTDFKIAEAVNEVFPSIRQRISYTNTDTTLNRNIVLASDDPLKQVDFQIFIQTKYNQLLPLYITTGNTISIKIAFTKRDIFSDI